MKKKKLPLLLLRARLRPRRMSLPEHSLELESQVLTAKTARLRARK